MTNEEWIKEAELLRDLSAQWSEMLENMLAISPPLPDFRNSKFRMNKYEWNLRYDNPTFGKRVTPPPPQAMTVHEFDSRQAEINTKCDRSMDFYQKALSTLASSGEDYAFELNQYEFWKQRKEDDTADLMQEFVRLHRAAKKAA